MARSVELVGFERTTYLSKQQIKMLPTSLESATIRMMRSDSIAREPEIFGNAFVDHYGGTREHEVRLWNQAVTNWEGAFYRWPDFGTELMIIFLVERYLELA